jgi:glucose/arabinose dehydrogenase
MWNRLEAASLPKSAIASQLRRDYAVEAAAMFKKSLLLTGFVNDKGEARGRPVGVAIDKRGDLLVADDVGNTVWRVTGETERSNVAASD